MIKPFPSDRIGRESMKTCEWVEDTEGGWTANCGMHWWLEDGTPKTNGMIYCPACGKRLEQKWGRCE